MPKQIRVSELSPLKRPSLEPEHPGYVRGSKRIRPFGSASASACASGVLKPLPSERKFKLLPVVVGNGAYAKVYQCEDVVSGQPGVAKMMKLKMLKKSFETEVEILQRVSHPNIVEYFGKKERSGNGFIYMELIPGKSLDQWVDADGPFDEKEAMIYFAQMVSALHYLHECGIAHHDVKSENIVIDRATKTAKLIDFGLSTFYERNQLIDTYGGSPLYLCPEVLASQPHSAVASDLWSLGMVLFNMLMADYPWAAETFEELVDCVCNDGAPYPFKSEYPFHLTPIVREILNGLIEFDAKKRWGFQALGEALDRYFQS